jgi:hypothetical protein
MTVKMHLQHAGGQNVHFTHVVVINVPTPGQERKENEGGGWIGRQCTTLIFDLLNADFMLTSKSFEGWDRGNFYMSTFLMISLSTRKSLENENGRFLDRLDTHAWTKKYVCCFPKIIVYTFCFFF